MDCSLSQIAALLNCELEGKDINVTGTAIDSRKIEKGTLFIALVGEHSDGHDYIASARLAGASAALVSVKQEDELPQLLVDDVVVAFGQIAHFWRQQCRAKVIAITGSNGKTTVKEMVSRILNQTGSSVIATQGNLNNELGVPLTLTRLNKDTDYAVIEMGANHRGEIARLVAMAMPDVAIINNVAAAHLEGFKNIEGVAKAKAEIFSGLSEHGVAVFNSDMDFVEPWTLVIGNTQYSTFALHASADIQAENIQIDPTASHFMVKLNNEFNYFNLPLPGEHNISNALAAITVTSALGIPVDAMEKGLALMPSVPHRLQLRKGLNQSQLIDDSYNANPGSYQRALSALMSFSGKHWLVLGDFAELGADSVMIHRQMGGQAKEAGVARLWTIGEQSEYATEEFGDGAQHFTSMDELQKGLEEVLSDDINCLIKGSRFMKLDQLADALSVSGEH